MRFVENFTLLPTVKYFKNHQGFGKVIAKIQHHLF